MDFFGLHRRHVWRLPLLRKSIPCGIDSRTARPWTCSLPAYPRGLRVVVRRGDFEIWSARLVEHLFLLFVGIGRGRLERSGAFTLRRAWARWTCRSDTRPAWQPHLLANMRSRASVPAAQREFADIDAEIDTFAGTGQR